MITGWINRHQQQVIAYQQEEIREYRWPSPMPFVEAI
jgi:hypothetical protein